MLPSDKPEFLKVLIGLAAIKPGKDLTPEALDIWWQSMQDWPLDDFKAAAGHLAKSCEFMPNPFNFEQLKKAAQPTKHEAWAAALDRARKSYLPRPNDAIGRAVNLVGGYLAIGHTFNDQLPFMAKRFMEAYEEAGEVREVRQALPGITMKELALQAGVKAIG